MADSATWRRAQLQPQPVCPDAQNDSITATPIPVNENNNVSRAGRLAAFVDEWQKITNDQYVLDVIRGYQIPFTETPSQINEPPILPNTPSEYTNITEAVSKLLLSGAIKVSNEESGQFLSNIFSVPKADGSVRLVVNLKPLNVFINSPHFKMEDYRTAQNLLRPDYFMSVIDLKEAYHAILVDKAHQKYLKFRWNNTLYQFTCLPFGLNIAPFVYTKIMRPVLANLRGQGCNSVTFLDDSLIIGKTKKLCEKFVKITLSLFSNLGLTVNVKKSQLNPSKEVRFLGFIFNTEKYSMWLPEDKRSKISIKINQFLNVSTFSIRECAELVGLLGAATPAVNYGAVYLKELEHDKNEALIHNSGDYSKSMNISEISKLDLLWWASTLRSSSKSLYKDNYDCVLTTDASKSGWGGETAGLVTKGSWSGNESALHINELELLAVLYSLQSFHLSMGKNILLKCDNTTAISYINNQGGCRKSGCHNIAKRIWRWAEERNCQLFATYINTKINVTADALSRADRDTTDFRLNKKLFENISNELGKPNIDLFASRLTFQCDRYVSWYPDPNSCAVDAFTLEWKDGFYAFPPFCLLPRVLNKIMEDQCVGIVVAPQWTAQAWYPLYMDMKISKIIVLKSKSLLWCPYLNSNHEMSRKITLMAAVVSGKL